MKKLMYLGSWVFLFTISWVSCICSVDENIIPEIEEIYLSKLDTIVILDPATGREIKQVIELKNTNWIAQKPK